MKAIELNRQNVDAAYDSGIAAGIDAALAIVIERRNYWRSRRLKAAFPPGMIESELQSVETRIRALRNRSPA